MSLTHLDLFSGIGGFALAASWAGFETVAFCEKDAFCQKVLRKNFGDIPIFDDVRTLTGESLRQRRISRVDLVTGGFPCQPFSLAGKRLGEKDDRHLWPEMRRIIAEVRPAWVCGENVGNFVRMALDDVLSDLEEEGYEAWTLVIPASAVDAPHRRDRCWILAHSAGLRLLEQQPALWATPSEQSPLRHPGLGSPDLAHSTLSMLETQRAWQETGWRKPPDGGRWFAEPGVGRVADGIPARVDRLGALGNAIVPEVAYPILRLIADYERERRPHPPPHTGG